MRSMRSHPPLLYLQVIGFEAPAAHGRDGAHAPAAHGMDGTQGPGTVVEEKAHGEGGEGWGAADDADVADGPEDDAETRAWKATERHLLLPLWDGATIHGMRASPLPPSLLCDTLTQCQAQGCVGALANLGGAMRWRKKASPCTFYAAGAKTCGQAIRLWISWKDGYKDVVPSSRLMGPSKARKRWLEGITNDACAHAHAHTCMARTAEGPDCNSASARSMPLFHSRASQAKIGCL
jgi:hypothetical protein